MVNKREQEHTQINPHFLAKHQATHLEDIMYAVRTHNESGLFVSLQLPSSVITLLILLLLSLLKTKCAVLVDYSMCGPYIDTPRLKKHAGACMPLGPWTAPWLMGFL